MSPRPAASRHDASARQFLDAAASLIDAAMTTSDQVPPRLRSIHFPAALEWIRVEDVIRLAGGAPGSSKKAFHQRWATRDEFLLDAAVYALQFTSSQPDDYAPIITRIKSLDLSDLGGSIADVARDLLTFAESNPRSYLMLHLGGVLHRHPRLQDAFVEAWEPMRAPFVEGYLTLLERLGFGLRPEWTPVRFDRALHALVDGFLLQGRIRPDESNDDAWTHADLFAETVVALTLGVVDADGSALTARQAVTAVVADRRQH